MSLRHPELDPLRWPVYWSHPSIASTFFRDLPVIGINARAKKELNAVLACRTPDAHRAAWLHYAVEYDAIISISTIIKQWLNWYNALFIPEDPCQIIFWDPSKAMKYEGLVLELIEQHNLPSDLFDHLSELDYGSFVLRALADGV